MKEKFITTAVVLVCFAMLHSACTRNNIEELVGAPGCDTTATGYAAEIKPILDINCNISGCHNSSSAMGGYDLENFASLQVVALGSRFLGAIRHETGFSPMPKGRSKLDQCQIKKIEIWVANGALNN